MVANNLPRSLPGPRLRIFRAVQVDHCYSSSTNHHGWITYYSRSHAFLSATEEARKKYGFSQESNSRSETDQDLRSACRCVACFYFISFLRTGSVGGGGRGMLPDFFFCPLFPVQQTTSGIDHRVNIGSFFGLAINTLNVTNNNNSN